MTQCAEIIVGFTANVGNVFLSNVYKLFYFLHFLMFFSVFYFHLNVYYVYGVCDIATIPNYVTEESSLVSDASWSREACAFVIFVCSLVSNFVASELMLLSCAATLRYVHWATSLSDLT